MLSIVPVVYLWESEDFSFKIGLLDNFRVECNVSDDNYIQHFFWISFKLIFFRVEKGILGDIITFDGQFEIYFCTENSK